MATHGSTHVKKSDLIKKGRSGKKSIVKYDIPKANTSEGEQYARIISCLGSMQFKIELSDKTQIRAKAGNTFKKSKRNPLAEPIAVGNLVKIDSYLGLHIINHVYNGNDEEELRKMGELDAVAPSSSQINDIMNQESNIDTVNDDWLDNI
jgi:hypothetical protein